jgi:hypothetical protein
MTSGALTALLLFATLVASVPLYMALLISRLVSIYSSCQPPIVVNEMDQT